MATPQEKPHDRLIRVQGPALPVIRLASETNSTTPVSQLIRVPGLVVNMFPAPATPAATVHLTLPLATGDAGEKMFRTLHALIEKVNEVEAIFDRAGVCVDGTFSGVRDGEVVIVLAPNDPTDAMDTCKRVADYLFAASRKTPGIMVKVFAADKSETPVYELSA